MSAYLPVQDPITPKWLTAVLRQSGALQSGEVLSVESETTGAFNSRTSRLLVYYSTDVAPEIPTRLILKQNIEGDWGVEAGADEVKFYDLVAALTDQPPGIVPCYGAAYDAESGSSFLLLRDLSETHRPPRTRDQLVGIVEGVPSAADVEAVVEALGRLHAYWWDHALLDEGTFDVGYWSRDAERFEAYLKRRGTAWGRLIAEEDVWFPADLRRLYEEVFTHLPGYWEWRLKPRFEQKRNLTLVHGDAYFSNFLCPTQPGTDATYLLDWQSPSFDIGAYDLVNLCATFWTSEQRHDDEREGWILRRYHAALRAHGVEDYSWDDLLTDYRHGLIFWLLMPVQDRAGGSNRDYWWPKMQCLAAAFREWECAEMLGA